MHFSTPDRCDKSLLWQQRKIGGGSPAIECKKHQVSKASGYSGSGEVPVENMLVTYGMFKDAGVPQSLCSV